MVYSCIGAEIEDSDGSSTCDIKAPDQDTDRLATISDASPESQSNGHVVSCTVQTDRRMERGRERSVDPASQMAAGSRAPCGTRPSLAAVRQRPLQESIGIADSGIVFLVAAFYTWMNLLS